MKRRNAFLLAIAALVAVFAGATRVYEREAAQRAAAEAQGKLALLVRPHMVSTGRSDARVHVVEFLDPACETCRAFYPFVKNILKAQQGRVRLSVRHIPLHPGADEVVRVLEASRRQGLYWQTLEALLAAQPSWTINHQARPELIWPHLEGLGLDLEQLRRDMRSPEIEQNMRQDQADARALGVKATPEYFVNGRPLPGFGDRELDELIREELARAYPS